MDGHVGSPLGEQQQQESSPGDTPGEENAPVDRDAHAHDYTELEFRAARRPKLRGEPCR